MFIGINQNFIPNCANALTEEELEKIILQAVVEAEYELTRIGREAYLSEKNLIKGKSNEPQITH